MAACEALHHAHEQGVVHRDVTPANLLVGYDGVVKLADFGIAKSQQLASRSRTTVGTLKGKVPYMSPEQARAQPLDRRSDIFSLGIVAWELIAGQRLFQRRSELDMLRAVQMCDVPRLKRGRSDVPPTLAVAIETALAARPEERWATAAEFSRALGAWLTSAGEVPSPVHLGATMRSLFGSDACARRLAATRATGEQTGVMGLPVPDRDAPRFSPLHPERWIPQIAMHLHLPPPRLRLVLPLLALVISFGGLLFGMHSPHAHPPLTGVIAAPLMPATIIAPAPAAAPAAAAATAAPSAAATTGAAISAPATPGAAPMAAAPAPRALHHSDNVDTRHRARPHGRTRFLLRKRSRR